MKATLRLPRPTSYSEYLAVEQQSEHRHEYLEGVVVAMAGGSDEHNAIAGRFAMLLGVVGLRDGCRYYTPDQRFWIAAHVRGRYSDGSVICGKPHHPAHDAQATTNPTVVFEVLSPSSEGDDQGDKRHDFQSLETLGAYVVASQDRRHVEVHRRRSDGAWTELAEVYEDGQSFELPAALGAIAVSDLYAGVLDGDGRSLLR